MAGSDPIIADANTPVNDGDKRRSLGENVGRFLRLKELGIAIPMVLIFVTIGIINPRFFSVLNIINMLRNSAFVFIIGVTMTSVFIGGGLDLSVGSTLALGGVIGGLLSLQAFQFGYPFYLAYLSVRRLDS